MASNKVPLKGYMDGIDISAWQDTIDTVSYTHLTLPTKA